MLSIGFSFVGDGAVGGARVTIADEVIKVLEEITGVEVEYAVTLHLRGVARFVTEDAG